MSLQKDLDTATEWASRWQMQFNVKKCKVVHFGKGNLGFSYSMEGHCLENVDYNKDLGVVMSKDLEVARQCQESYSKANWMLGLISRTIKSGGLIESEQVNGASTSGILLHSVESSLHEGQTDA